MSRSRPWRPVPRIRLAAMAVAVIALVGCSGDDDGATDTTTTTGAAGATTSGASTSTTATSQPGASADPVDGITEGQEITVSAEGFSPDQDLGITQCAERADGGVGQGDCDLGGIDILHVGADGSGTGTASVTIGPFGENQHVCTDPDTRCFLSVGQLVDSPVAERAPDVNLTFAAP